MLKWSAQYQTGVGEIDEHHKKLFEIADRAYNLLKAEHYSDKYDKIVAIFTELQEYTLFHFQYEEEYMKKIGYKKFLSHKVEHNDFIEKLKSVDLEKIDHNQEQYLLELLDFIVAWIQKHILEKDKLIPTQ